MSSRVEMMAQKGMMGQKGGPNPQMMMGAPNPQIMGMMGMMGKSGAPMMPGGKGMMPGMSGLNIGSWQRF